MVVDIRASVSCSLGVVISGSLADDYLQGNGLIKTKGEVVLAGTQVPVVGTPVTFTYVKEGTTHTLPRKLRVLSSFADPFRRTTTVQLGCKLTYLDNRKPPVEDPNSKDENADVPCNVFAQATLSISAKYVFEQCLEALELESDTVPLTNKFAIMEFDLSPGYIQVMSDLLQSEGYVGYLNSAEKLKFIDMSLDTGEGPLFKAEDIVDIGPIGAGELPGESVIVRWSNQRLAPPKDEEYGDEYLKRSWEIEEIFGAPSEVTVSYTSDSGSVISDLDYFYPYTFNATRYDVWDRKIESIAYTLTSSAEVNNRWANDRFKTGRFWNLATARLTRELVEYKVPAPATNSVNLMAIQEVGLGVDSIKGALSEAILAHTGPADLCKEEAGDDADVITKQTTFNYISELELAGSLNIDSYITVSTSGAQGEAIAFDTVARELDSVVTVEYEVDTASGISKHITERSISRSQTVSGQQDLATKAQTIDYANLANSISQLMGDARKQVYLGAETRITTQREFGLQKRPNENDRNKTNNARTQVTESTASFIWVSGSTTTTAVTEFALPYAPDDEITWSPTAGFSAIESDVRQKALKYGRIQNRLLIGNRNGLSLQVAPNRLPTKPFDPLYIEAAGYRAGYRVNGTSWAFDANGIVVSTDALLWGAVSATEGGDLADSWVPLPPIFNDLPPSEDPETDENGDPVLDPPIVYPPYSETVLLLAVTRTSAVVVDTPYSFDRGTETVVLQTLTGVVIGTSLAAGAATFILTGKESVRAYARSLAGGVGAFALTGYGAGSLREYSIGTNAGTFTLSGENIELLKQGAPLAGEAGSFALTGQAADSFRGVSVYGAAGTFVLAGQDAERSGGFLLGAEAAAFSSNGETAQFTYVSPQIKLLTYTGNGTTTNAITGVGFQPGLVWVKSLAVTTSGHVVYPALTNPYPSSSNYAGLVLNAAGANSAGSAFLTFDTSGFTLKSSVATSGNASGTLYWALCLKAGSTAVSNSDGTISTTVSVNSDLGFSQIAYDPTGTAGTLGHGLGVAPELVFIYVLGASNSIRVGGSLIGDNSYLTTRFTNARTTDSNMIQTVTSSTINIGTATAVNNSTASRAIALAFVSKAGVSKIGSYTGNGAATQAITGLGFSPSFVMAKSYIGGTSDWVMFTKDRDGRLVANTTAAEAATDYITFDSDGFTLESGASVNTSGVSYLYLAFR